MAEYFPVVPDTVRIRNSFPAPSSIVFFCGFLKDKVFQNICYDNLKTPF